MNAAAVRLAVQRRRRALTRGRLLRQYIKSEARGALRRHHAVYRHRMRDLVDSVSRADLDKLPFYEHEVDFLEQTYREALPGLVQQVRADGDCVAYLDHRKQTHSEDEHAAFVKLLFEGA